MQKGIEYTEEYFLKCLVESTPFEVAPSPTWSDDEWFLHQEERTFHKNSGPIIIQAGSAEGIIVGANTAIFTSLKGTEYFPSLKGKILISRR